MFIRQAGMPESIIRSFIMSREVGQGTERLEGQRGRGGVLFIK